MDYLIQNEEMNMNDYHDNKAFKVRVLLSKIVNLKQGNEENERSQQAVYSIVKKFETTPGTTDGRLNLLAEVLTDPYYPSPCITIKESVDKRIQITYKKEYPHVVCCRLWRFADLQNHNELEASPYCEYPFSSSSSSGVPQHSEKRGRKRGAHEKMTRVMGRVFKLQKKQSRSATLLPRNNKNENLVCINPYHYNRKPSEVLPSIVEPRMNKENMYSPQWIIPERLSSWCTITYYELNKKVGDEFRASSSKIIVDGFTSPFKKFTNRFSLGVLGNEQRTKEVKDIRASIEKGIELIECCNGDVWIRNRSWSCSVYFRSILYNRLHELKDSTVCRLKPRHSIDSIFNASFFSQLVNDPFATYESIFELTKLCTIQVSFNYEFDQYKITSTPCWLSILLNEPLRPIDIRLQQLSPEEATTSSR